MINWYKKVVFENYANFNGRARRSEFWYFMLMNFIIGIILMSIDNLLHAKIGNSNTGIFGTTYSLAVFIPSLALAVRRLHDTGKSGLLAVIFNLSTKCLFITIAIYGLHFLPRFSNTIAFALIVLPLGIIAIWLLVLYCTEGNQGENKYGSDPKLIEEEIGTN